MFWLPLATLALTQPAEVRIGEWKSGEVEEKFVRREWDVSHIVTGDGELTVRFQYTSGGCRLDIGGVWLRADGEIVAKDEHEGSTGHADQNNRYRLKVGNHLPGLKLVLEAMIRADGGTDSNGFVAVRFRPKGTPLALRKPVDPAALSLVPWPVSIHTQGSVSLPEDARIRAEHPSLQPLARILALEANEAHGLRWREGGGAKTVLVLDPALAAEEYTLDVDDKGVSVRGGSYAAVAMGTTTLLQSISKVDRSVRVPKMTVRDRPAFGYRGLLIDVARKYHRIDTLKQIVQMCRLYKIRYLQLHLTDDQSFTFPSKAYPKLNSVNQHGGPSYTRPELEDIVKFAEERGVTIIPEMEFPGHAAAMIRAMPELFKIAGTTPYEHHATINFANPKVLEAVETLIGEVCDVFKSSPYFHMGGDEADIAHADQHPDFQRAFREHGLQGKAQHEIFRKFILQVNDIVKRHGKRLIVWEGFGREPNTKFPIPRDVLIMEFESAYYLPTHLLEDGYELVNAAWTPLYVVDRHVWPASKVYEWNVRRFGRFTKSYPQTRWFDAPSADRILGAQFCSWELAEHQQIWMLRRAVPAMAERVWNGDAAPTYSDFERRHAGTDRLLERLVQPVSIRPGPLLELEENEFDLPMFEDTLAITLENTLGKGILRFTTDGSPVLSGSPMYRGAIEIGETTTIRARLFGMDGRAIGYESSATFYRRE